MGSTPPRNPAAGQIQKGPRIKSYFAVSLQFDAAKQIGRHFVQDSIVWVGADAVPQLIPAARRVLGMFTKNTL